MSLATRFAPLTVAGRVDVIRSASAIATSVFINPSTLEHQPIALARLYVGLIVNPNVGIPSSTRGGVR
jgi:hypothetical protein